MLDTLKELGRFLGRRKKYVLLPVVFTLVLLAMLLVFAQGSAVAPFIYTVF
jgi:hypothetical protein